MFIQSQNVVSSSNSISDLVSSSTTSKGIFLGAPKKRKALDYYNESVASDLSFVDSTSFSSLVNNSSGSIQQDTTEILGDSPNGPPFVRASTIKLLDTYQRCGQKVSLDIMLVGFSLVAPWSFKTS